MREKPKAALIGNLKMLSLQSIRFIDAKPFLYFDQENRLAMVHNTFARYSNGSFQDFSTYIYELLDAFQSMAGMRKIQENTPDPVVGIGGHTHFQTWAHGWIDYSQKHPMALGKVEFEIFKDGQDHDRQIDFKKSPYWSNGDNRCIQPKIWINPGSVSLPRDGVQKGGYAILTIDNHVVSVQFKRVPIPQLI